MDQITLRLGDDLKDELEAEADERGVSRSEHIRDVLESRENTDRLRERLADREARIKELEEQLRRRRNRIDAVKEEIEDLPARVAEEQADQPDPPFFVRWARWFRSRRGE